MKKLILLLVLTVVLTSPISAATTVYDNDWPGWYAAVGGYYLLENFNDATLNPELSVVSDNGGINAGGYWYDSLYLVAQYTTTWYFSVPIYAFGGTWDLGGPGGPGSNIEVLINDSWVQVGIIDNEKINEFWGFVSTVPFTQVRLQAYNSEGSAETYILDDLVYSALEQYLTGGGQIVAGTGKRKDQNVVSFSGNLGYTGDLTLMGQYQFHFQNVSHVFCGDNEDDILDGAIFHSTSVETLVFYNDDEGGPAPPPAYSNVAYYAINGRLKAKGYDWIDGFTIYAYVADRGEPGGNDSINFALWYGPYVIYSSTWDFPHDSAVYTPGETVTEFLAVGNLQIHSEY